MGSCKFPCTPADRTRQCRGGACPSRRNAADTNGLPLKRYALPNCHCEGALRPWQSRAGSHDFADSFPTIQLGTARFPRRFAPRNDKFGSRCGRRECLQICDCLRRSGSAATDAIGAHHANDSLYQFAGAAPSVAHPRIHAKTGADGVRSRLLCSFTDCCAASSSGAFWLRDPVRACGCAGSAA